MPTSLPVESPMMRIEASETSLASLSSSRWPIGSAYCASAPFAPLAAAGRDPAIPRGPAARRARGPVAPAAPAAPSRAPRPRRCAPAAPVSAARAAGLRSASEIVPLRMSRLWMLLSRMSADPISVRAVAVPAITTTPKITIAASSRLRIRPW